MADGPGRNAQNWASNRIKHALHLPGWLFEGGDHSLLKRSGKPVLVSEYEPEMKTHIFCPECCCPLFRSPTKVDADKGGRNAYFAHRRNIKTECGLRTKKAEGKKYLTEEDAVQAIIDGNLVIVEGFLKTRPVSPIKIAEEYDQTLVEDQDGEIASVPISRHRGKKFNLPSKLTTVRGLCRNFDESLYRYYFFPHAKHAQLLFDALRQISEIDGPTDLPILAFGTVVSMWDAGPNPHNVRFIMVKFLASSGFKDFSIKLPISDAEDHHLNTASVGRTLLVYGQVRESGLGLSMSNLGWGEISLLPKKYEHYLSIG